ncbi:MAG: fibronectin type III domain-containing protein [Candidatus Manganitrophus sp. SB1]|nr:fibronectin type III domain-containing protein [Candidatus Manganitrophus morganii]
MQTSLIKRSALMIIGMILLLNWKTPAMAADASLSWDTNTENDLGGYKLYYGTSSGSYGAPVDVGNQTSFTVNGLSSSQTYYFAVRAYNTSGAESGYSNEVSKSFGDTAAPTLSAIAAGSITSAGATVSWSTNEAATSQVEYGATTAYGSLSALNSTLVTSHSRVLSGLNPSTTYHYRVISRDAAGNTGTSGDRTFTTTAAPDTTAPAISGIGASNITTTAATISWTTNESSDTQIQYGTTTSYGSSTTLDTTLTTNHSQQVTGLLPATLYHYRVRGRDGAGNLATSGDRTFTTAAPPDTTAPTLSNIAASNIASTSTVITWSTNETATSQVEYGTTTSYGASSALGATPVTSHSRTLSSLSPATTYNYRVISQDGAGNISVSGNRTFTTSATPDTTAPVLSGIAVGNVASTSVVISWSTHEAATSQVEYGPTTAYGSLSTLNTTLLAAHSASLTNLQPATTYNYRVISRDAAGNTATSGNNSFTTAAPSSSDTIGPVLSAIDAREMTTEGVTIHWGTDEPATSEVEYGLTAGYENSTGVNATLSNSHSRILSGLQSNTVYHYRVKSADALGNLSVSADHTLTTNPPTDSTPPADVENFTAVPGTQVITLSWVNPSDSDFVGVRIVYRTDRFPNGTEDGEILGDFSGRTDESITVLHAGLEENVTYYYSASSYDNNGNYQHTAHASAMPFGFSTGASNADDGGAGGGGGCTMVSPSSGAASGPGHSADMIGLILVLSLAALRKGIKK